MLKTFFFYLQFFFSLEIVSLCSLGWPRTHLVDKVGLKLIMLASAGIKEYATFPASQNIFKAFLYDPANIKKKKKDQEEMYWSI